MFSAGFPIYPPLKLLRCTRVPEITEIRSQLTRFLTTLKEAEAQTMKRANHLWQTKIQTEADIETILGEVESLVSAFENLPRDLEDLQLMRHVLKLYQNGYTRLSDENLNWKEFEALAEELRKEWTTTLGDEEPPWLPGNTLEGFLKTISDQRKQNSTAWIESVETQVENIPTMPADEANRLYNRLSTPPPVLTDSHIKRVGVVVSQIQARLEALSVEWLIEKFKELPAKAKKDFLAQLQKLSKDAL